ncbi:uncharacterized protein TM35_000251800 [Trypanosoma theileri]|uniref:Uncharacterized protein n=1 Tax=Trypanosoma theileri TaxID=67003 RepID=A0A1X0NQA8_9TRYP|nr:uncharacterized protein TM35_000251800 [Trypanosoma theileri]ORC86884.1 hypothetical protein TM35_000251800 [Trypanosoma theileri]
MITEGLFTALVRQAWSNPAALRTDDGGTDATYYNQHQQHQLEEEEQRRQTQSAVNRGMRSPTAAGANNNNNSTTAAPPSYSPLDHPALLMAYYEASCNALLRYHYDIPILQPRTTYRLPRRTSPASVGHSRTRPPRHSERSDMRGTAGHRTSPPYIHLRRDRVLPSMSPAAAAVAAGTATSADMAYRAGRYTDLQGTANTRSMTAEHARGSWGLADFADEDEDVSTTNTTNTGGGGGGRGSVFIEGRPSWSPRQRRYREASSGSHYNYGSGPRGSSSIPLDRLNYGGFGDEEAEEEEEGEREREGGGNDMDDEDDDDNESVDVVPEGRRTVRLGSRPMVHHHHHHHYYQSRHSSHHHHSSQHPSHHHHHSHYYHHYHHHHSGGVPDVVPLWTAAQRSSSRGSVNGSAPTYEWREEGDDDDELLSSPDSNLHTTLRGEGGI